MNRRVIAAVVAIVLAIVGGVMLVFYVQSADARAMANQQPTSVLVVKAPIARGTAGENLAALVEVRQLPRAAAAKGAVSSVDALKGLVASIDLKEGEQVLSSRFVKPGDPEAVDAVKVPENLQQLSILLEPERVVGTRIAAGDTVGVFATLTGNNAAQTHLILNSVLVTRVQGAAPVATDTSGAQASAPPSQKVIVTLALSSADAERIVFALENGKIWLSQVRTTTTYEGIKVVNAGNVLG